MNVSWIMDWRLTSVLQLIDLLILCFFGFFDWPYIKMIFPIVLALFLPIRSDEIR